MKEELLLKDRFIKKVMLHQVDNFFIVDGLGKKLKLMKMII